MKKIGVVRQIDELGRIVIPSEIRNILRIKEGDFLDITSDDKDSIFIKKHSKVESIEHFADKLTDSIYKSSKKEIIIIENDKVIAASGAFNNIIIGQTIHPQLSDQISLKEDLQYNIDSPLAITLNYTLKGYAILKPIVVLDKAIGCVIVGSDNLISEMEEILASYASTFLEKHLEQ